jgi:hypothetical protein
VKWGDFEWLVVRPFDGPNCFAVAPEADLPEFDISYPDIEERDLYTKSP